MRTDAQLRTLFDECCQLLPADDLSTLQNFWRDHSALDGIPVGFAPLLCRVPIVTIQRGEGEPVELPGTCASTNGFKFWFKAIVVDEVPDEILRIIIVHELGHALRAAAWLAIPAERRPVRVTDEEEAAANALCDELDFDRGVMLEWLGENRVLLGLPEV